ncbi:MAG: restriction endonuclease subunit S [Rhodanobacter sp.]
MAEQASKAMSSPRKRGSSDFATVEAQALDPGLRRDDEQKQKPVSTRLGDVVNFKRGYDLPESSRRPGPYPVISSAGISGYHDQYKIRGEGIVTGRYGTLGEMHYYNGDYWPHNTALYVTDFKGNVPKYVYYLLSCLGHLNTGDKSAVPGVNRNDLHELMIPLIVERGVQQKIAAVLSALDAKIELNNRINTELEALAKTIYDYWFVQFDFPDAHGRPYKSSGGAMVWNDALKREIPAEWESVSLRHLVDCNANSYGANNLPDHIVYLDTGNLTENRLFGLEKYNTSKDEVPSRARRIASNGDVLYSTVRPNQNHHGIIKEVMDDLVVSTGFAVLTCTDKHLNGDFIYMFVRGGDIATKMRRIAESSRSSYPSIAPDDLLDLRLALPEDRTQLSKACKFFDQTFMKIWANEKENRELTQLRDWLLPLLMNGQVRVA